MVTPTMESDICFQRGLDSLINGSAEAALFYFQEAERLGGDPCACAAQRWDCWMLLGDFENAWRESDYIARNQVPDNQCLWDGKPFDGKRVLIRCLHGFGDAIQFIRYASLVRRVAARVIVEVPAELISLFRAQPYIDEVISWSDGSSKGYSDWDQQIEVMEFPRAFRTSVDTVPAEVPYLTVDDARVDRACELLRSYPGPNVGIVWSASDWNPLRSIPLTALQPILHNRRASFFSFQHGEQRAQLCGVQPGVEILDTAALCPDISDTAAMLMNMDLLITVDTMAAHLAGALGVAVWTLLPYQADWRWIIGRDDSPWYPTMRLFRQHSPNDWNAPVAAMAKLMDSALS